MSTSSEDSLAPYLLDPAIPMLFVPLQLADILLVDCRILSWWEEVVWVRGEEGGATRKVPTRLNKLQVSGQLLFSRGQYGLDEWRAQFS